MRRPFTNYFLDFWRQAQLRLFWFFRLLGCIWAICCEKNIPVPGTPAVARIPVGPAVIFAPLGPTETDAPLLLRLSRMPGRSEKVLRKRKRHFVDVLQMKHNESNTYAHGGITG